MARPKTVPAQPPAEPVTPPRLPSSGGAWEIVDGRFVRLEGPPSEAADSAVQTPFEGAVE